MGEGSIQLKAPPGDFSVLSGDAKAIYVFLKSEGALFQAEVAACAELSDAALETALLELVMAGLATNDSMAVLQRPVEYGAPKRATPRPLRSLEADLAERFSSRQEHMGGVRRPSRGKMHAAKRCILQRMEQSAPAPVVQTGRWALVHRFGVLCKALPPNERWTMQARQLLARHSIVTHASLDDEYGASEWRVLYLEFQRLEMRGEVRRGHFPRGWPVCNSPCRRSSSSCAVGPDRAKQTVALW